MSNKKRKTSETEVVFEYTGSEDVPKDATIVRFHSSVAEVGVGVFKECDQLKKVVLNEGLQKIGKYSFSACHELERIKFSSLENINLPSTLLEISERAFYNCSSLKEDVVLNEGLQTIGNYAFFGCSSLKSITLPSTMTDIGDSAFASCYNMETAILNETLQTIGVHLLKHHWKELQSLMP